MIRKGWPKADIQTRFRCRTAASRDRPFTHHAAFSFGRSQQCGLSFRSARVLDLRCKCESRQERRVESGRSFSVQRKIKIPWESCNPALELGKSDGKVPRHSWTNLANNPQPPNSNWFGIMFRKRKTTNGGKATHVAAPCCRNASALNEIKYLSSCRQFDRIAAAANTAVVGGAGTPPLERPVTVVLF